MATSTTNPDYYSLLRINFVDQGYAKNGTFERIGAFDRDTSIGFCDEILVRPDLAGITGNVTSVIIRFKMEANLLGTTGRSVEVRVQNQGTWTDTPTTEPVYETFDVDTAWPATLASSDLFTSSTALGQKTIDSTAALVAYFQDLVNDDEPNDGIMLTLNTFFADFRFRISTIEIEVQFDPAVRNRMMILN